MFALRFSWLQLPSIHRSSPPPAAISLFSSPSQCQSYEPPRDNTERPLCVQFRLFFQQSVYQFFFPSLTTDCQKYLKGLTPSPLQCGRFSTSHTYRNILLYVLTIGLLRYVCEDFPARNEFFWDSPPFLPTPLKCGYTSIIGETS